MATPTSRRRKPVDPETTLFRPGSISKLFTWTAVMQQVERGKLDLDADVNTYLDFKIPPGPAGEPLTIARHHDPHAGVRRGDQGTDHGEPGPAHAARRHGEDAGLPDRIFKAGTMPAYSNYATALAGYIVERISGLSFDDYLDQNIFRAARHGAFIVPPAVAEGARWPPCRRATRMTPPSPRATS